MQTEKCFSVNCSGLADFSPFGLEKLLFFYINMKNFFCYCPVKAMLGNVELSSIKHSCKKGVLGAKVVSLPVPPNLKI